MWTQKDEDLWKEWCKLKEEEERQEENKDKQEK